MAEFFFRSGTDRKPVIAALLRNPAIAESVVMKFAERADSELVPGIIFAAIERRNRAFLAALGANRDSLRFRHEIEEALREIEKNWTKRLRRLRATSRSTAKKLPPSSTCLSS